MSHPRATWRAMGVPSRLVAVAALVVPLVLVSVLTAGLVLGSPTPPPQPAAAAPSSEAVVASSSASVSPPPSQEPSQSTDLEVAPSSSPSEAPLVADPLLGTDGRLTLLLLGSDSRPGHRGNRTDAIMVVTIDPTTGQSAAFSVPRDIVDFPLPTSGRYGAKVTGLYQHLAATTGNGPKAMKQAVGRAFGIEVDRYVLIGFSGVTRLVGAVGGVDVTLAEPYYDPYYWVTNKKRGWGLPAGKSHLDANDALIFARSRKGDSDFSRAKRQQLLVMAALSKVRKRGVGDLPKLLSIARDTVRTDLPLDRAADIFELYSTVDLDVANHVVFGPKKYAVRAGGTDYALELDVCAKWIAANFPPARPYGAWPAT